jgi:hypothetical protein
MCNEARLGFHGFCAQHKCASFWLFCFWQEHAMKLSTDETFCGRRGGAGAGDFVAGFLLGGVVFGALGYLLAPQVCICSTPSL